MTYRVLVVNERGVVLLQEFHADSTAATARAQALAKVPGNAVDVQQGDLDREQLFWPNGRRLP
jgi:hypothetical protein